MVFSPFVVGAESNLDADHVKTSRFFRGTMVTGAHMGGDFFEAAKTCFPAVPVSWSRFETLDQDMKNRSMWGWSGFGHHHAYAHKRASGGIIPLKFDPDTIAPITAALVFAPPIFVALFLRPFPTVWINCQAEFSTIGMPCLYMPAIAFAVANNIG
jgi:hypothetical protein